MSVDSYDALKAEALAYLNRIGHTQLEAEIPTFISLAQKRIFRSLRVLEMLTVAPFTLTGPTTTLPVALADVLEVKAIVFSSGNTPKTINPQALLTVLALQQTVGDPLYYAITANGLHVGPAPHNNVATYFVYYSKPAEITEAVQTNLLTQIAGDLLLYAVLWEAALFQKDDNRAPVYKNRYLETLQELHDQNEKRARNDGGGEVVNADLIFGHGGIVP